MSAESRPYDLRFFVGPFPVVVEPTFWLTTLLLGLNLKSVPSIATWVGVCFVSILVHELGHAVVAKAFGAHSAIRLYSFGGLCMPDRQLSRWRDLVMSAAGPFAGFLFAAVIFGLSLLHPPTSAFGQELQWQLLWINVVWGLVNLLPILPLDGGHVMADILGPKRRTWALGISAGTAAIVVAHALATQSLYRALLFGFLLVQSAQAFLAERPVRAQKPAKPEPDALPRGWKALQSGQELEASRFAHLAVAAAKTREALNAARDLQAWIALAEGNPRTAALALQKISPPEDARPLSWALVFEAAEEPERALPFALKAMEKEPSVSSATIAIRLLGTVGRFDEAERAVLAFSWPDTAMRQARLEELRAARAAAVPSPMVAPATAG